MNPEAESDPGLEKLAAYTISRGAATVYALVIGIAIGVVNTLWRPIDFTPRLSLLLWALAAIFATVFIHEGIHGLAAVICGHKPIFGVKLPLVFVTFKTRVPRGPFMLIALAPLVILDIIFGILFYYGILKEFSFFILIINTIGAIGDMWIVTKLLPHKKGTLVQDTKAGIEVWQKKGDR